MKRVLGITGIVLVVLVGVSATLSYAQQKQGAGDRVSVERGEMKERQPPPPGDVRFEFNREVQGPDGAPPPPGMPGDFVFIASELNFGGKVVKGAPYSAQAITESVQTLGDGNRIINKSTAAVYRDSEGRTRREQTLRAIGGFANSGEPPQTILISDPVADKSYILDPRTRTAQKMPPMSFTFNFKMPPPSADKASLPAGPPQFDRFERNQVAIGRADMAASGGSETNFMWRGGNHAATDEALGKQNIEGVEAEGTRSVMTIPAGEIGNERPIEIISERWYSPELQAVVMTRHADPRFGESTYRLTNIDRSEPARSLFEVPADYTLKTGPMGHGGGIGFGVGGAAGIGGGDSIVTFRSGGAGGAEVLNGKATSLPIPAYPQIAKAARAAGNVMVEVTVDENGNVVAAKAVSGHPLLQAASVAAALNAKFVPGKPSGQAMKGILVYTFSSDSNQTSKESN
jgi:TonB family protein